MSANNWIRQLVNSTFRPLRRNRRRRESEALSLRQLHKQRPQVEPLEGRCLLAPLLPTWYEPDKGGFNPYIPDFYQHQNWVFNGPITSWEGGAARGGWCAIAASADVFYDLTKRHYTGLLNITDDDFKDATKLFAKVYGTDAKGTGSEIRRLAADMLGKTMQDYLNTHGHHTVDDLTAPLVADSVNVDPNGNVTYTTPAPAAGGGKIKTKELFDFYNEKARAGDDLLLVLGPGTANPAPWWNFHVVAGAGLDVANKTVYVADPDSNNGSTQDKAGWPNFDDWPRTKLLPGSSPPLRVVLDIVSKPGDPIPIPKAPMFGNADSYNQYYAAFALGHGNNVVGDTADVRYSGTVVTHVITISAPHERLAGSILVPGEGVMTSLAINSGVNTVDGIYIAPSAPVVNFSDLSSFTSSGSTWKRTITPIDPFGNTRVFGGVEYDLQSGSGLDPSMTGLATLGTTTDFSGTGFEVLLHFKGTPSDQWDPEVIGQAPAPSDVLTVQSGALSTDNFNRPDSPAPGDPWSVTTGALALSGNQIVSQAANASVAVLNGISATDVSLQATVDLGAGTATRGMGLVGRYSGPGDSNMYLGWVCYRGGQTYAEIWRNVGGAWTELSSAAVAGTSGTLRFDVVGTTLSLYFNGVLATQVSDGAITGPGTVGFRSWNPGTALDDFSAFDASGEQPPPATLPYSDDFNRDDGPTPGGPWSVTTGALALSGDQMVSQAANGSVATLNGVSATDVGLQATVDLGTGTETRGMGLVARYSGPGDSNMYLGWLCYRDGQTYAEIWRNVGGAWTELSSAAVAGTSGTLGFNVMGTSLALYFNGVLTIQASDGAITGRGTVGFRSWNPGTTLDDLSAFGIAAERPPLATLPYSDAFNRADIPVPGGPWSVTTGSLPLSGDQVVSRGENASVAVLNGVSAADASLQATVDLGTGTETRGMGLVARYSGLGDSNMYLGWLCYRDGQTYAEIWRNVGGTWTELTSAALSGTSGTVRFDVVGTSLSLYFNGVLAAQASDGAITGPGTVGFRSWNPGTGLDDFSAALA